MAYFQGEEMEKKSKPKGIVGNLKDVGGQFLLGVWKGMGQPPKPPKK